MSDSLFSKEYETGKSRIAPGGNVSSLGSYNNIGSPTLRPSNIIGNSSRGLGLRTRNPMAGVTGNGDGAEHVQKASKRLAEDGHTQGGSNENPKRGKFEQKSCSGHNIDSNTRGLHLPTTSPLISSVPTHLGDDKMLQGSADKNAHVVVGTISTDPEVHVIAFLNNANHLALMFDESDKKKSVVNFGHKTRVNFDQVVFYPEFLKGNDIDTKNHIKCLLQGSASSSCTLIPISSTLMFDPSTYLKSD